MDVTIRQYRPDDEPSWLRCRVLSFLGTCYFDDVQPRRARVDGVELVAVADAQVVALLDVEVAGDAATIACVAVHPDHQRRGLATRLLDAALAELRHRPAPPQTLDAWTREDEPALRWYASRGFVEEVRYLHVHLDHTEGPAVLSAPDGLRPVSGFAHAPIERETELRRRFHRVYRCRRLVRDLTPAVGHHP